MNPNDNEEQPTNNPNPQPNNQAPSGPPYQPTPPQPPTGPQAPTEPQPPANPQTPTDLGGRSIPPSPQTNHNFRPTTPQAPMSASQNPPKKSKKKLIIFILILILAAIGGFFAYQNFIANDASNDEVVTVQEPSEEPETTVAEACTIEDEGALPPAEFADRLNDPCDIERVNDLQTIQQSLETYFTSNGSYPSLEQANDVEFRTTELQLTDSAIFVDPMGTEAEFLNEPATLRYAFIPLSETGQDCDNTAVTCGRYTLVATLTDESTIEITDLQTQTTETNQE